MKKNSTETKHFQTFESLREEVNGFEFWCTRKVAKIFEHHECRNFIPVIGKAKNACKKSRRKVENHFVDVHKRNELREHNKILVETAQKAGVETTLDFAVLQNHECKGLYGGLNAKAAKGIKK